MDILSEGNVTEVEIVTDVYEDLNATEATDIYPTDATVFATEEFDENATDTADYYTDEPYTTPFGNYTEEYVTEVMEEVGEPLNFTCADLILPRRYDIEDLGSDCLFRGWADVQGQGAANDYCRYVCF